MATCQMILADVDLRYRNTFTTAQKLVWLNEEERELFDVLEIDSPPYAFQTVANVNLYPFPAQFDFTKIKAVTYQVSVTPEPSFIEVDFKRNDDHQEVGYDVWYTIVSDAMFLYVPDSVPDGRTVYVYCDMDPTGVTEATVTSEPNLPVKYQEILKLGILKRIAMSRKDVLMHNNYDSSYQQKIAEVMWQRKMKEPEFTAATDVMPRAGYGRYYGYVSTVTGP